MMTSQSPRVDSTGAAHPPRHVRAWRSAATPTLLLAAAGLGATCSMSAWAAPLSGAIYTSTKSGGTVNANIYANKADVYLNGGPQNANAAGLPFDNVLGEAYYFQVTDPSGKTLLSTDDAVCRQVLVKPSAVSGKGVVSGTAPVPDTCTPHALGDYNPTNGSTPVQLLPYDDTPNNGGEYKLWLIRKTAATSIDPMNPRVLVFANSDTKTDNFKVRDPETPPPPDPRYSIEGTKFYDSNVDGVQNNGEPGIFNYQIELFGDESSNTTTALKPLGMYSFGGLKAGTYGVCEVIPEGGQKWIATTAQEISPIVVGPDSKGNDFGNVCLAGGNGRTLGFWSNKNGQSLVKAYAIAGLTALNLRNANGSDFDPKDAAALSKWLLAATATNMANMLSAQMAAMWLNVNVGGPDGAVPASSQLYAGMAPLNCTVNGLKANGFINVNDLINAANASLLASPNTVASGPVRSCQEFMKNALDNGNNNRNFVGAPTQCEVMYSGMEPSCSPPAP